MTYNCIIADCKMRSTCASAYIYNKVGESVVHLQVYNPKNLRWNDDGSCQYYRKPQRVTYAYGFVAASKLMTCEQYSSFMHAGISHWNRTDFYMMRRGTMAISPERQQCLLEMARSTGFTIPESFWDRVEEVVE